MRHQYRKGPRISVGAKAKRTRGPFVFDSIKEAKYYDQLLLRQKAGEVVTFLRQVPFHLPGGTVYRADFLIFLSDGQVEVVDVKGMKTDTYKIKKREVEAHYHPIQITEA